MDKIYQSTRNADIKATSKQAILQGICPDGGLYVYPELDKIHLDLKKICSQSYQQNALYILKNILPDYSESELRDCIQKAYTDRFSDKNITPLKKVGNIYVLELFHGPTSAFKDVALTLLPQLMQKALHSTHDKAMILTATSGDTGKAALSGFQDVESVGITVFYPYGKVSTIQYRQMVTQKGKNTKVVGIKGTFDDAQSQVKKIFLETELKTECKKNNVLLPSAKSINIGRLIPQIVYYFEAYKVLVKQGVISIGEKISFSVPTGNFGDVLAGYYGYLMGLPVEKFYVASNANKVLTDFLKTGVYNRNRKFIQTISPSMDILVSSNLERLLYYMSGKDTEKVSSWMISLKETGKYDIGKDTLQKIQNLFDCGYVDDQQTRETIREVYENEGYVLDPHSAIAYRLIQNRKGVCVSLATASPYKFSQDVVNALTGREYGEWQAMKKLETYCQYDAPKALTELENLEITHKDVIEIHEMKQAVKKACKVCL